MSDEVSTFERQFQSIQSSMEQGRRRNFQVGNRALGDTGLAGIESAMGAGEIDVLSAILAEEQIQG